MATIQKVRRGQRTTIRELASGEMKVVGMDKNRLRIEIGGIHPTVFVLSITDAELQRLKRYIQ